MSNPKVKRVLVSVTDKSGVADFARALVDEFGAEIISTGGTARALRTEGGGLTIELEFSPAEQAGQGEEKGEGATR